MYVKDWKVKIPFFGLSPLEKEYRAPLLRVENVTIAGCFLLITK